MKPKLIQNFSLITSFYLRPGVDALQRLSGQRVPESDTSIRCSASGRQQAVLMRRPGDGFHGGHMLRVRLHGVGRRLIPHE